MNKRKFFVVCAELLIFFAAVANYAAFFSWGLNVSKTALLWHHGILAGYMQIFILATVPAGLLSLPAVIIWDEYESNK